VITEKFIDSSFHNEVSFPCLEKLQINGTGLSEGKESHCTFAGDAFSRLRGSGN
jgi:hypothetical protein